MKENKINWWLIIGIIIVVAIITALVTMQVTGNVVSVSWTRPEQTACANACYAERNCSSLGSISAINACKRLCNNGCTRASVYTKSEVDALLLNASINGVTIQSGDPNWDSAIIARLASMSTSIAGLRAEIEEMNSSLNARISLVNRTNTSGSGSVVSTVSCSDISNPSPGESDSAASCSVSCPTGTALSGWICRGDYITCSPGFVASEYTWGIRTVSGSGHCVRI